MTMDNGRVPDGTGLSQAEPQEGLGPSGFDPSRGRPSQHGAVLGEALADLAKAGAVGTDLLSAMCATCAFREGSLANQIAATGAIALNCVLDIDPDDFACHHGMKHGEPTRLCAGYLAAKLAGRPVALAAVQTVAARLATLPAHDPVRAAFDAKAARFDPEGRMDNYQWGRALLRDSDGSPEGEKPQALSAQHDSAGPKDIARA